MGIPNGHLITPEIEILTYEGMRLPNKGPVFRDKGHVILQKKRGILLK